MELFGGEEEKKEKKEPEEKKTEEKFELKLEGEELKRSLISGASTEYSLNLGNTGTKDDNLVAKIDLIYSTEKSDESPEWTVKIRGMGRELWDVTTTNEMERELVLEKGETRTVTVDVTAPKGARYGDKLNLILNIFSKNDPAASETVTLSSTAKQTIKAVKTSIGHEKTVADSIASIAKARDIGVFSILSPTTLRGYVLVETMNPDRLEEVVRGVRRARGVVKGDTMLSEIDHFLIPKPIVSGMMEGDIVELIAGPFKGEKARVQQIDESKEEITVELFEAVVPIPVTVRGDSVRVLKKEKEDRVEENA
jgi:transcriptional antiterminator NusG